MQLQHTAKLFPSTAAVLKARAKLGDKACCLSIIYKALFSVSLTLNRAQRD